MWSAGEADDKERFLADLRALRDTVALEFDELAARAHYPSDVLKEAENGPSLPGLPILAAYVRACDGDVLEWEERWRRLGFESRADPGLPVRAAGASPAAVAGARASVSVAPPDAYDPERIRAALRGSHGRSDGGARGTVSRAASRRVEPDAAGPAAEPRVPESPAAWSDGTSWEETTRWGADAQPGTGWDAAARPGAGLDAGAQPGAGLDAGAQLGTGVGLDAGAQPGTGTSWDGFQPDAGPRWDSVAADLGVTSANGNHHVIQTEDGSSETAVTPVPDEARADGLQHDPFSADWLQDSEPTSPPDPDSGSSERAEAQASSGAKENWFTPRETADPERTWLPADAEPVAVATDTWFTARERDEGGSESAEIQRPGPSSSQEQAIPRASWPASAESPAGGTPGAADRPTSVLAPAAAAATSRTIAGPAVPPGPVVPPSKSRPDRLFLVRLLMVIVVAALIGSILVLLLR